jgi:hypothetical protein
MWHGHLARVSRCGTGILPVFRDVVRASCPCFMGETPMPRWFFKNLLDKAPLADT